MRLLIIEDDADLAQGLKRALQLTGHVVDTLSTGSEALAALRATSYSAVVLDLGLPDMDGLDVLRYVRATGLAAPVIVLTARDGLTDRVRGLDAGADDYMVKPFAVEELQARLRAVVRRKAELTDRWIAVGDLSFDLEHREAMLRGEPLDLPARELALLGKLVERIGKVVSKEALYEAAFAWDDEASPQAVEVYVSRLRRRLEPGGVQIRTFRGLGYRLEATDG